MNDESIATMYIKKEHFPKDMNIEDTFYYDETNNFRRFCLRNNGFNNDITNAYFILGGIAVPKGILPDVERLKIKLDFPKETKELKFQKFIGRKKDIYSIFKSKKINMLLTWLIEEHLYIHYLALNFLYFSIADITDSLPNDEASKHALLSFYRPIKNALYTEILKNKDSYINLLYKYEYPNIKKNAKRDFVSDLYDLCFSTYEGHNQPNDFYKEILRQLFRSAKDNNSLVFLENNEDFILIEDFYINYITQMLRFPNGNHLFDEEAEVEYEIKEKHSDLKDYVSYSFVNSEKEFYIQLSDVIIGLISKFFSFLENIDTNAIMQFIDGLEINGLEIISKLKALIDVSDKKTKLSLCFIGADNSNHKIKFAYLYGEYLLKKHQENGKKEGKFSYE